MLRAVARIGSGELSYLAMPIGFYLGSLVRESSCKGYGVDISVPAIDAAAKRYPETEWVVANADRLVPYAN